jgi:predicted ATP-grasp superfamily ATP-dependent carboligase
MDALVTDTHVISAVAGLRGLGRSGLDVIALAPHRTGAGLWSRYAAVRAVGPDPEFDEGGFARRITELAAEHGPVVVYPGREAAVDPILSATPPLPADAVLPYPDVSAVAVLRDRRNLPALAEGAGLRTPATLYEGPAQGLADATVRVPCVVKPGALGGSLPSPRTVDSEEELRALVRGLPEREPLVVQERAQGALVALDLVVDREGELAARFQYVTRRTWPLEAGPPSLALGVEPDEQLFGKAARMLADAGYAGLAELQFIDSAKGPTLIDVNLRFFGTMPLALASGVNLPAAWHSVVTGEERPPRPGDYRVGVGFRWLEADVTAALRGSPGLLLQRAPRPSSGAMWARDDPIGATLLAAEAVLARVRRRLP